VAYETHEYGLDEQIYSFNDAIADDWEVELEVYEIECECCYVTHHTISAGSSSEHSYFGLQLNTKDTQVSFGKLQGKRVKATFEVLD
jgi:hypothetical protein